MKYYSYFNTTFYFGGRKPIKILSLPIFLYLMKKTHDEIPVPRKC